MKSLFFVVKKKFLIIFICLILISTAVLIYFSAIKQTFKPAPTHTIVIDAGHGGVDGGADGKISSESELNLAYSQTLQKLFEQYGFKVVLTRNSEAGLYSPLASNKKRSEMENRRRIIKKNNPDLVISVHMNSFSMDKVRGAQVYYDKNNEAGKDLAESVQGYLFNHVEYAKKFAKEGDFYILNCTKIPSILIECGFISNAEEEKLLNDKIYRENLCYNILCGVLLYFKME